VSEPTLPTGVLEPSGRLFSDYLLESVKRRARTPISQATLDTWEVLAIADEQIRGALAPLMIATGEDYLTADSDQAIVTTDATYRPPHRAMKLREVVFLDADGDEVDIPRIALEEIPNQSDGFYIKGNEVTLLAPEDWGGHSVRMTYYLRPSRLVLGASAGIVSSVNRQSGVVTLHAASANLTGATRCDLVRGTPPFEVSALDVVCTVSGTSVTITTAANIPADWGTSGDFVCLPQQTPAPQIHPDLFPLLAQFVTVQVLDGNGDVAAYQRAAEELKKLRIEAGTLLRNRVEGEPIPIGGYSPIWDRAWDAGTGGWRR
jgi:hypothetical protein